MLQYLPIEILHMIFREIACARALARLSQVNKYMHRASIPFLYEEVVIQSSEALLGRLNISPVSTRFESDGSRTIFHQLTLAKGLELVTPIRKITRKRCYEGKYIDHPDTGPEWKNNRCARDKLIRVLDSTFQHIVFHLPDHHLKSFSWQLGCCIPAAVLGSDGWLASKQESIQSLSLTTDGTCHNIQDDIGGLLKLSQLRSFSWKGLHHYESCIPAVIRGVLMSNSGHLERLELEAVGGEFNSALSIGEFLGRSSLPPSESALEPQDTDEYPMIAFHSLLHLSFGWISVKSARKILVSAVRVEKLRSLTLHNCPGTTEFIETLEATGRATKLRSFEVTLGEEEHLNWSRVFPALWLFLRSLECLEELFVSVQGRVSLVDTAVLNFTSTLKRLVLHFGLDERERSELHLTTIPTIPLECVGVGYHSPLIWRQTLESNAITDAVKLIHCRINGAKYRPLNSTRLISSPSEACSAKGGSQNCMLPMCMPCLRDFANWAFGPSGLRNLLVVAFGDFRMKVASDGRNFFYAASSDHQRSCFVLWVARTTIVCWSRLMVLAGC
ncbi:hypothetical protein BJX61DRAFT_217612 [Aspergillus egyptiacus]|nr:hypothetical protein BJX61DRAFT_217612 [Aspergillus egyptiacus]